MASSIKKLEQVGGRILFQVLEPAFQRRSPERAEQLGAKLGKIGYKLVKRQREKGLLSLGVAFPELSRAEHERLLYESFLHFGRVAGDFLRSTVRTDEEVLESIEVVGRAIGERARDEGRGLLAVLPHHGNWERLAHWFNATGGKLSVVARSANDSEMERQVLRIREKAGMTVIGRDGGGREVLRRLHNNEFIGILPDQNSNESFLPYFGKPAGTVLGPAKLAMKTNTPILPVFCPRIGVCRYRLIVKDTIPVNPGDTPEDVMTRVNAVFEEVIREYPDQYLWMHDRWKSARRRGLLD